VIALVARYFTERNQALLRLTDLGRFEDAATIFGAAEAGRVRLDAAMPAWDHLGYQRDVTSVPRSAAIRTAWDQGRGLDLEQACHLATAICDSVQVGTPPGS
jgi:hypothetical protein